MFFTIAFAVAFGILLSHLLAEMPLIIFGVAIIIIITVYCGIQIAIPIIGIVMHYGIEIFHEFCKDPIGVMLGWAFIYFFGRFIYIHYNGCNITAESIGRVIHFK